MSNSKKIVILGVVFLTAYLMLVSILFYRNSDSKARSLPPPISPTCVQGLKKIHLRRECQDGRMRAYRQANFECYGGSRGELQSKDCISGEDFSALAKENCYRMSKCLLTPTITSFPSPGPTCIPEPPCLRTPPFCNFPEPVGGWCPISKPTPIVVDDCVWCGSACVNGPLKPGQICNQAFPPKGYECKRVGGICQAIKPPVSTVPCPSPPRCGPGGNLIIGDPAPGSGTVCPQYFCQNPSPN